MWLPRKIIREINAIARIRYISVEECKAWNKHRQDGELRLLCGWEWIEREGNRHRQGFKSQTVCLRDAYYVLIKGEEAPGLPTEARRKSQKLRVISAPERSVHA